MIEMHIPENVKLWESPGRAGGLPDCNYYRVSGKSLSFFISGLPALFTREQFRGENGV